MKAIPQVVMVWSEQELIIELVSKKSGFLNCSEENPFAHCSASALRLVRCAFAKSLIDERLIEQEYYASSLFYYAFALLSVFLGKRKQTL